MKDIQDNFDLEKIVQYYLDGKLITWLESHYYDTQAESVRMLNKSDRNLRKRFCQIFDVEYEESENTPKLTELEERNRKLSILKQFTSDPDILGNLGHVAFDQEDLVNLLDDCVRKIYLCNNSFTIPLRVHWKDYIGLGNVEVTFAEKEIVYPDTFVTFNNVHFHPDIENWLHTTADGLYKLSMFSPDKESGEYVSYLLRAAEMGNTDAMVAYSWKCDDRKQWIRKAAELGNGEAIENWSVYQSHDDLRQLYEKAAAYGSMKALWELSSAYQKEWYGCSRDVSTARMLIGISAHSYAEGWSPREYIDYHFFGFGERELMNSSLFTDVEKKNFLYKISKSGSIYGMREEASCILGISDHGIIPKDDSRSQYAINLLEKTARVGDPHCMKLLGDCYAKGIGVQENFNKAEKWYNRAIQYDSFYTFDLAEMYEDKGMRQDALKTYQNFIDITEDFIDVAADREKDRFAKAKERINALESGIG